MPEALQDMLLIPRTPTPPPLEDRPLEELSVEELRELAGRQKVDLVQQQKIQAPNSHAGSP